MVGNVHEFATENVDGKDIFLTKGGSLRSRLLFSRCSYSSHISSDSGNDIGFRYVMPIK